jgi:hypothetical protein
MVVVRTIDWVDDHVVLIDQTRLPREERQLQVTTVDELVDAISRLAVRGAPALGGAGALGVLLAVQEAERSGWDEAAAAAPGSAARPTGCRLERASAPAHGDSAAWAGYPDPPRSTTTAKPAASTPSRRSVRMTHVAERCRSGNLRLQHKRRGRIAGTSSPLDRADLCSWWVLVTGAVALSSTGARGNQRSGDDGEYLLRWTVDVGVSSCARNSAVQRGARIQANGPR